ncbi:MAG TPA: DNA repair protein RecO [Gemmatimonadales bacterium]|nr:DNA repair protein RecO [Gemmatimonadales bacterium]
MAPIATPAIILRTYRYSETSKIVRLATRELGLQSGIAKGALRPRSRFGAGLEIFSEGTVEVYYREARELHTVSAFEVADLHRGLALALGRFAGATALAQVFLKMAPPSPVPAAYEALGRGLAVLERVAPEAVDAAAVRWLWMLLGALGFAPSLRTCVKDGAPVDADLAGNGGRSAGRAIAFSAAEGGVLCPRCAPTHPPSHPPTRLPGRAYRDLLALNDPGAELPVLDAAHAAAHRRLVARFARHHLGEPGPLFALDFWERHAWAAAS